MNNEVKKLQSERESAELHRLIDNLLNNDNWQLRLSAISDLLKLKRTNEYYDLFFPALRKAIKDTNDFVRQGAITAIGDIGGEAHKVIDELQNILKTGSKEEKKIAIHSLGKIGYHSAIASEDLIDIFKEDDSELEKSTSWALGVIGPDTLSNLRNAFSVGNIPIKRGVIQSIGNMGPSAIYCLDLLLSSLKDNDISIRIEAAKAVGNLRAAPEIISSVNALKEALNDSDPDVRWTVSEALRKIGTEEAMSAWSSYEAVDTLDARLKQLLNEDKAIRLSAAEALYLIIEKDSEIDFSILKKSLRDNYYKVPIAVCEALSKIEKVAAPLMPELLELTQTSEVSLKVAAINSIGKIGTNSENENEVVQTIIKLLEDQNKEVRLASGLALELLDTDDTKKALKKFKWE